MSVRARNGHTVKGYGFLNEISHILSALAGDAGCIAKPVFSVKQETSNVDLDASSGYNGYLLICRVYWLDRADDIQCEGSTLDEDAYWV
jgi:hypothetical protein